MTAATILNELFQEDSFIFGSPVTVNEWSLKVATRYSDEKKTKVEQDREDNGGLRGPENDSINYAQPVQFDQGWCPL